MKDQFNVSLLEQIPTPLLDAMLRAELEKELPEEDAVRGILKVLREREADVPVVFNDEIGAAWRSFEKKTAPKQSKFKAPLSKAAAVLLLCGLLLFTIPHNASAGSFFSRIAAWTESIFELFSRMDQDDVPMEYTFHTDHPGLQELYDKVTELGVTVPVVPMWLDEGYELRTCNISTTPNTIKVLAGFVAGEHEAVFELNIYGNNIPREFHKDASDTKKYERNGTIHYVFQNEELWTVVWTKENVECSIVIACQEDVLYRILNSIYTMED